MQFNFDAQTVMKVGRIHASMLNQKSDDPFVRQIALSHKQQFNSCVIVQDEYHPKDVFDKIYDSLQPSCPIAIFSQHVQPLAELQEHMIRNKMALMIRLEEMWCREY